MLMALYHKWPNSSILQLKLAPASTCAYLTPIPQPLRDAWPGPASKIDLISINKTFRTPNPDVLCVGLPKHQACGPVSVPSQLRGPGPTKVTAPQILQLPGLLLGHCSSGPHRICKGHRGTSDSWAPMRGGWEDKRPQPAGRKAFLHDAIHGPLLGRNAF